MKRKTWLYGGLAVAGLAALLGWAFAPRPVEVEVAQADRGRFETTIDEEGRTRLRDRYLVSAPLAGRLGRITLEPGDAVDAGTELAVLTPTLAPLLDARAQRELSARVEGARANVQRAARQAEAARVALAQARSDQQRSEQLVAQGFVSPTKAEADRLGVQAAQQTLQAAIAGRQVAEQELEMARAALDAAQPGADPARRFAVRSPVAGRVLRVLQASEATVAPGAPLIEIGDTAQLEVVAELLTTDALQARPGSAVRIEQWGGAGTLPGRVRLVEPAAFTKVSALGVEEQRVNVRIDFAPMPALPASQAAQAAALGDGYRVGVRIVLVDEADVLRVPVSAVFPRPAGTDGQPGGHAVFVVEDGRARERAVGVGGRNGRHAWITQGLDAGATVIVYPPPAVVDGARVRERRT